MKRGLVLGGGGVIGVAWETGLVAGLAEGGIDVRLADIVVGTSAGSMVGTRIAAGQDVTVPAARSSIGAPVRDGGPDVAKLGEIFGKWSAAETMTEALCAEIGALAESARTAEEEAWIAATGGSLGVPDWPDTDLRVTAVDVRSGAFAVHSKESGAPLHAAVASSCAVPGLFPPITISGRRYMDGGVRSGTSADLLVPDAPEVVLVVAPICAKTASFGPLAERCMNAEVAALRQSGASVCGVIPGDTEIEAFGPNLMDSGRAEGARQAGWQRGLELAKGEAGIWNS